MRGTWGRHRIARWIRLNDVHQFAAREVQNQDVGGRASVEEYEEALALLERHYWIRETT